MNTRRIEFLRAAWGAVLLVAPGVVLSALHGVPEAAHRLAGASDPPVGSGTGSPNSVHANITIR